MAKSALRPLGIFERARQNILHANDESVARPAERDAHAFTLAQNATERAWPGSRQKRSGLKHQFRVNLFRTADRCIIHMYDYKVSCFSTLLTEPLKRREISALLQPKPCHTNVTSIRGTAR